MGIPHGWYVHIALAPLARLPALQAHLDVQPEYLQCTMHIYPKHEDPTQIFTRIHWQISTEKKWPLFSS